MNRAVQCRQIVAWVLMLSMCLAVPGVGTLVAAQGIRIVHNPVRAFVPGFRIIVKAGFSDPSGLGVTRCYFRAKGEANFVFVNMTRAAAGGFSATLPAPSASTEAIEYLLLASTGSRAAVKTQTWVMTRTNGTSPTEWQTTNTSGQLSVSTELAQAPESVAGFTDSIATDVVESAARFGMVAGGLYAVASGAGPAGFVGVQTAAIPGDILSAAAPASGTAPAAAAGGGAAAAHSSALPWIIVGGVVVAGGAVGLAVGLGGGNKLTSKSIVGNWSYRGTVGQYTLTGTITFAAGGTFTYNAVASPISSGRSGTGSWTVSGGMVNIAENVEGWTLSGAFDGNKNQFTVTGANGTYVFTRQ